jgi:hypothetical protein
MVAPAARAAGTKERAMRDRDQHFISELTPPLRRLIADLHLLQAEAGLDGASRAYAAATADRLMREWARQLGLRRSQGHACLGRLRDGHCWARWEWRHGESAKERIPCDLPGADHMSLWLKDRRPAVYVSQPYHLSWDTLQELVTFGARWGLTIDVEPWPSWHFPSRVLTILVRARGQPWGEFDG